MTNHTTKVALTPARRHLIEIMQELNHGRIEGLAIRNGDPVITPQLRIVRTVKLSGENGPRPEVSLEDFVLKGKVRDLFEAFDSLKDGTILVLKVQHGLPITYEVEEAAA